MQAEHASDPTKLRRAVVVRLLHQSRNRVQLCDAGVVQCVGYRLCVLHKHCIVRGSSEIFCSKEKENISKVYFTAYYAVLLDMYLLITQPTVSDYSMYLTD